MKSYSYIFVCRDVILTLWNSYNFFTTYASLDKFDPKKEMISIDNREFLDKWVLSRFNKTIDEVRNYFKTFEVHKAARSIESFLIADFTNWYLRRSRKRLWVEEKTDDTKKANRSNFDRYGICHTQTACRGDKKPKKNI